MADRRTLGLIGIAYLAARIALLASMGSPGWHSDTPSYRAGVSLVGGAPRTWPFPLALDVFGDQGVTVFQTVVSAVSFCVLAWTLAGQMRDRRTEWAIGVIVLLLGLTPRVTTWDQMLLTESLAISLTALLIAALVHLDRLPWWTVAGVFTLWVFIRDGHLYLGVLVLAGVVWWAWKRRTAVLPAVMAGVMLWCGLAAQNDRYVEGFNVTANLGGRINYEREAVDWFLAEDIPLVEAMGERVVPDRIRGMYDDPEFGPWADHDGVALYFKFLVTHPEFLSRGLRYLFIEDPGYGVFPPEALTDHSTQQIVDHGYPFGPAFIWPSEGGAYTAILMLLAALAVLITARARRLDRSWLIPSALLATTPLHALLAWHATPYEIARHGVILSFVAVIGSWWMITLAVDRHLLASTRDVEPDQIEIPHLSDR